MPFKVNPDGSITCDTVEEALRLQRGIMNRQMAATAPTVTRTMTLPLSNGQSVAQEFLDKLKLYNGTTVNSEQMAKIVGTESSTGVGPKLRHYRNSLAHEGISLDEYLRTHKNNDGTTMWTIRYSSAEKSS